MQLEMRSQDLQLAQTLLGLNTEIQRLRRESFGGVEVEGDDQQWLASEHRLFSGEENMDMFFFSAAQETTLVDLKMTDVSV